MNKSQSHRNRLSKFDEQITFDIGFILAGLSLSNLTKAIEVMESVYSPSDGSNCDITGIDVTDSQIVIEIAPFGEKYDLIEFNIDSKLTILEGLENAR